MDIENTEMAVRRRIRQLQTEKGLTENGLSAGDPPAQKRLNRQLGHGAAITLDTILRILDACPDVSADWLLRGTGDIYIIKSTVTGAESVTGENATVIGSQQQTVTLSEEFVRDLLAEKDRQIQALLTILGK